MVCVAIYAVLVSGIAVADNLHTALWSVAAYTVVLCFSLFKTGSLRNQSGMLIRTHFKERREQPGLAVSAPAVMLWQYP